MNIILAKNNTSEIEQLLNLYTFTLFFSNVLKSLLKANKDIDSLKRVIWQFQRQSKILC